ncbi:MAG: DNA topoisomerase I, partial [Pontibacterium sp.]
LEDNILFIILIAILAVCALALNHYISQKEMREQARKSRLDWLGKQIDNVFETVKVLREIDCNPAISDRILQHALAMYEEIEMLAPESDLFARVTELRTVAEQALPTDNVLDSDRSIKRAQIYIGVAEKIIFALTKRGKLTPALAKSFIRDLYFLKVTVVSDAHIYQGRNMQDAGDEHSALSHYKHAKAILLKASIATAERKERLEKVNALITSIRPDKPRPRGTLADSIDRLL